MRLNSLAITEFVTLLRSSAPAPGGGSASALVGANGVALGMMAANLTVGKKKYADFAPIAEKARTDLEPLCDALLLCLEKDTEAFDAVMDAMKLPKETDEQKAIRKAAIQSATKEATLVPLSLLRLLRESISVLMTMQDAVNPNCVSDLGVGASCLRTAAEGAWLNVCINLGGLSDEDFVASVHAEAHRLYTETVALSSALFLAVEEKLRPVCNQTEA